MTAYTPTPDGTVDRYGRWKPAPVTPEQSAGLRDALRRAAGLEPCQHGTCTQPGRDRFGVLTLCRSHAVEAMATAYSMELAL